MNDRRQRLEAVFHTALEIDSPAERERYLDEACAKDPDLRCEVDELLKSAELADALFQAGATARHTPDALPGVILTEKPGDHIGRYKLLEKIGEGGMGVVYMAEQEQPVRRKVALKIIKLGMDTRSVVARFEAERQALAMMDHPNIAQVLDAGATEAGRPYFVMELVQGISITQFCEKEDLSTKERLNLFNSVCQAIQSAHQKGIIHRDIKPSNVLVTMHNGAPHPMVIDFGVAKAVDQKLTEKTLFTNFATMIGTPAYMSPEQAQMSRLDIDTRSDIYSLGVLLYELLTGTTPFPEQRLRNVAYGEMQRIIVEEEPERPSARLRKKIPAKFDIRLPKSKIDSDLDWIVMKCLEKDRNRRYDSATGLVSDIEAHLNEEPVIARPPTTAYRFQKFVRRNKLQFAATMFALVVLLVAVVVSSWQAVRASRAERSARQLAGIASEQTAIAKTESAHATAAKDFLIENLLGVYGYSEAPDTNAVTFEATQALVQKVAGRIEGRFTNQPLVEAEIRLALTRGLEAARDNERIAYQAEKALAIFRAIHGATHSNTLDTVKALAVAKYHLGQKKEAFDILSEAIATARHPTNRLSSAGAALIGTYGYLLARDGRAAEGLPYLNETLTFAKNDKNARPSAVIAWKAVMASAIEWSGDLENAEGLYREVYQDAARQLGAESLFTLQQLKAYARLLTKRNRWTEARPLLEQAALVTKTKYGPGYSALDAQVSLARAYEQNNETERARSLYSELHPQLAKHFPYEPAISYAIDIADFFVRQRNYKEAAAVFDSLRGSYETRPLQTPAEVERLITAAAASKGWPAAAEVCRKHLDTLSGEVHLWRRSCTVLLYGGDCAGYQEAVAKALALLPATTNPDLQWRIAELASFGPVPFSPDQIKLCETLLKSLESGLAIAATNQSTWHRIIAALQLRRGQFNDSLAHIEESLANLRAGSESARRLALKALVLHHLQRGDEARAALEQAETLMKPRLLDQLSEREGFLNHDERTYLIYRREARALLGLK